MHAAGRRRRMEFRLVRRRRRNPAGVRGRSRLAQRFLRQREPLHRPPREHPQREHLHRGPLDPPVARIAPAMPCRRLPTGRSARWTRSTATSSLLRISRRTSCRGRTSCRPSSPTETWEADDAGQENARERHPRRPDRHRRPGGGHRGDAHARQHQQGRFGSRRAGAQPDLLRGGWPAVRPRSPSRVWPRPDLDHARSGGAGGAPAPAASTPATSARSTAESRRAASRWSPPCRRFRRS